MVQKGGMAMSRRKPWATLTSLFQRDKHTTRTLYTWEWVVLIYLAATTIYILLFWTRLNHPADMLLMRARVLAVMLALWGLSRLWPAPITVLLRATAQLMMLSWWYPDTYDLNIVWPNLDHVFAAAEQNIFGCQPAALLSTWAPQPIVSEIMYLAYAAYFPMIALTAAYYFFCRQKDFPRAMTVLLAAFMTYYVIFVLLPVTGPQYYYLAVGEDNILNAQFPNLHYYFTTHADRMTAPGWTDGLFYDIVETAHQVGERPTAAFPSSHVGISTILLFLAHRAHSNPLFYTLLPFTLLMLVATVYIKAHYAIDVIAGLISAALIYTAINYTINITKKHR